MKPVKGETVYTFSADGAVYVVLFPTYAVNADSVCDSL